MIGRSLAGVGLLVVLLLGMTLAFQRPISIPLQLGHDEGYQNDLPWVRAFHAPETRTDTNQRYRWMPSQADLVFPAWPARSSVLSLMQNNGNPVTLAFNGWSVAGLDTGRAVHVYIPPTAQLTVQLSAEPFIAAAGDPRELAAALQAGSLQSTAAWSLPPMDVLAVWSFMLLSLLGMVWALGGALWEGIAAGAVLVAGAIAASVFAPLRVSYTSNAMLAMTVYSLIFAGACIALSWYSKLWQRVPKQYWRWMILLTTAVFALKLGGRLVPYSMPGDIGFHRNRVLAMLIGDVFRPGYHRGVDTPYPPIVYGLVQPLMISGISIEWLLQGLAALAETTILPLLGWLVYRMTASLRAGLFAAFIYGFYPAGFMNMAWSFDSHIITQWAIIVWSSALVFFWGRWHERSIFLGLTAGLAALLLGHFGFYINVSLFTGALALFMLWKQRRQGWAMVGMIVLAQLLVWGLYYSAFWDLLFGQLQEAVSGQSDNLSKRSFARADLLWDTVYLGFWFHFALVPLVLAPFGFYRLWHKHQPLTIVIGVTWLISALLGVLPLIIAAPLTTRWLMFSAWGVAVAAGIALDWLCQKRYSRWAIWGLSVFVAAFGLWVWLGAVIYRIRPPEPF